MTLEEDEEEVAVMMMMMIVNTLFIKCVGALPAQEVTWS